MARIPYGYQIVMGQAEPHPEEVDRLVHFMERYAAGSSVADAAKESGVDRAIANLTKMLRNEVYLGTDYYPPLVSEDLFERVQEEHERRLERAPKRTPRRPRPAIPIQTKFRMNRRFKGATRKDGNAAAQLIYKNIMIAKR